MSLRSHLSEAFENWRVERRVDRQYRWERQHPTYGPPIPPDLRRKLFNRELERFGLALAEGFSDSSRSYVAGTAAVHKELLLPPEHPLNAWFDWSAPE